ncbi:protein SMAX1-LIKE 3-like [Sesamum indicum]|uniref:Protein SMAX1-LIKE 3-like n=1 Tax=Sesamum indicum TaxID=4182 RepID=A0A6I9TAX3_SESIN|nr:protein SMAX1-LIKE 3-like [Sesamum indicum]
MRSGGCAVQQVLTAEAAGVVKQAVVLAKRRGHAQVTPLHVANTMLATSSGLFRIACLESHSHPLQCKALELCFNVALNRLPASSSNPMLAPSHSQHPSISNALVAAFKRAQAHQRRGSVENQQQPLLAVKIELEQLIISILDDPSVSRVMREAGFSSTQVKSNVEKAVSLELCSQSSPPHKNNSKENSLLTLQPSSSPPTTQNERKTRNPSEIPIRNEDVNIIIETLSTSRKRKSLVIVGECISNLETTVSGLMDRVDKGEVPDSLREVKFISIPPLYSFCNLQREEVEQKIGELSCLVKSLVEKGVILYLGDLKWISDYRVSLEQEKSYYCSVEHMIMEIGRLVWGIGEIGRFWLMGIATFQTYMRCRTGYHSLETAWGLHPITIPANSLGLSLVSDNDRREENQSSSLLLTNGEVKLCADCSAKFEAEAQDIQTSVLSGLPSWLKDERRRLSNNNQNCDSVMELRKKWNSFCSLAHKQPRSLDGILTLSSPCTSCFSFDQQNPNNSSLSGPMWKDSRHSGSNLIAHLQENGDSRNTFSSNPSNSANSSSDVMEIEYTQKFKEFNAENLNILCNALEKKVPWQRQVIPEIAGTILQSRSRMLRRKDQSDYRDHVKEETWLFFLGPDPQAKEQISRELAKIVFGSYSSFLSIGLSSFVSSDVDYRNKRGRDEESCMSYIERFAQAVSFNPHRVFLVEDLDQADYCSQMGVKRAIERGRIRNACGEEVGFYDAIVILSCESFSSRSRASSPNSSKHNKTENAAAGAGEEETGHCGSLDLNVSFDDTTVEDRPVDDLGILENVDRRVVFKIQDL